MSIFKDNEAENFGLYNEYFSKDLQGYNRGLFN